MIFEGGHKPSRDDAEPRSSPVAPTRATAVCSRPTHGGSVWRIMHTPTRIKDKFVLA